MNRQIPLEHAAHAQLLRKETLGNTIATAVIAALLTWLIFHREGSVDMLSAPPGGMFGIIPGTFNFTLLVTIGLTLVTRRRVSRGQYLRRRRVGAGWIERLPGNVLLRALLLAASLTLVLVPLAYALMWGGIRAGLWPAQWALWGVFLFYVLYFVLLSLIVTPLVVWRGLGD